MVQYAMIIWQYPSNPPQFQCHSDERPTCGDSFLIFCHRKMFTKLLSTIMLKCVWLAFKCYIYFSSLSLCGSQNVGLKSAKDMFSPTDCEAFSQTKTLQPRNVIITLLTLCVAFTFLTYANVLYIHLFTQHERSKKMMKCTTIRPDCRHQMIYTGIHAH